MIEPTQKEIEILRLKSRIFDMIKEKEVALNKANELQAVIQKCLTELDKLEKEM